MATAMEGMAEMEDVMAMEGATAMDSTMAMRW